MTGLIIKLISTPLIIYLVDMVSDRVNFASFWQIIMVSLILAAVGQFMEAGLLMKGSVLIGTGLDIVVTAMLLYLSGLVLWRVTVSFYGAIITALLIGVVEYFSHRYLVTSGKIEKFPFEGRK